MNFITNLDRMLDEKFLLKHPFYDAWHAGKLSKTDLGTYAAQYFHHVLAFPRYLSATHSNCDDSAGRQALLANLIEEEHGSQNHPELWLQFAEGLGVSREQVKSAALLPATKNLIDTFMSLSKKSYAEGLGALYAYERQVPEVAKSKIAGLKQHYGVDDAKTLKFFKLHAEIDVIHSQVTRELLEKLSPEDKQKATDAANQAANALWAFLTGVQAVTIGECEMAH